MTDLALVISPLDFTVGVLEELNLERRRGDTVDLLIRLLFGGNPINVTGYSARLTVNSLKYPADISTQIFQTVGAPNSPGTDGLFRFDMALLAGSPLVAPGAYYYDIEVTDDVGEVLTLAFGRFVIKQDISK